MRLTGSCNLRIAPPKIQIKATETRSPLKKTVSERVITAKVTQRARKAIGIERQRARGVTIRDHRTQTRRVGILAARRV